MGLELNFGRKAEHAQKLDHDQLGPDMKPLSHCPLKMKPAIPFSIIFVTSKLRGDAQQDWASYN